MNKTFILLISFCIAFCCNAQHLTYSSFWYCLKKMDDGISAFNDAMTSRGYYYAGTNSKETKAVWCNNCTYDFEYEQFTWTTGEPRSLLVFTVLDDGSVDIKYIFPTLSSYKAFKSAAKKDGFKFVSDEMKKDYIFSKYKKKKIYMNFYEYSDKYEVILYVPNEE